MSFVDNPRSLPELVDEVDALVLAQLTLKERRMAAVHETLRDLGVSRVADLGCGESDDGSALPSFYSSRMHFDNGQPIDFRSLDSLIELLPERPRVVMKIDMEEPRLRSSGTGWGPASVPSRHTMRGALRHGGRGRAGDTPCSPRPSDVSGW